MPYFRNKFPNVFTSACEFLSQASEVRGRRSNWSKRAHALSLGQIFALPSLYFRLHTVSRTGGGREERGGGGEKRLLVSNEISFVRHGTDYFRGMGFADCCLADRWLASIGSLLFRCYIRSPRAGWTDRSRYKSQFIVICLVFPECKSLTFLKMGLIKFRLVSVSLSSITNRYISIVGTSSRSLVNYCRLFSHVWIFSFAILFLISGGNSEICSVVVTTFILLNQSFEFCENSSLIADCF